MPLLFLGPNEAADVLYSSIREAKDVAGMLCTVGVAVVASTWIAGHISTIAEHSVANLGASVYVAFRDNVINRLGA